jgi:3-oxoacyl-[acyl-carrier protein] reductase
VKRILVTGASRGIGRATVEKLLRAEYEVVGVYNSSTEEARQLEAKNTGLIMLHADFSQRDSTLKLIDRLKGESLDGIVNVAGIFEQDGFKKFDLSVWEKTMEVNATVPLMLVQNLQTQLNPGSSVVNIASNDASVGGYLSISYSASKATLINLTKSMAVNLGPKNIRVNAVAPGWIDTGMGSDATGVTAEAIAKTPLGRNGRPEEVAELIEFLLSDRSSFINGETIYIDGGYSIVDEVLKREFEINS